MSWIWAGESQQTLDQYGIGKSSTDSFGRKWLLARRLVEKGRPICSRPTPGIGTATTTSEKAHGSLIEAVDLPIAGLLLDLKQRGMLKEHVGGVVW